jgi:hypothetical protein
VSPAWARPGQQVAFRHAATEMGPLSATLRFAADGALLTVASAFHHPPRRLVVRIPHFVELEGFETDAAQAEQRGEELYLSPDLQRLALRWHERPGAYARTFQGLLEAFRREPSAHVEDGRLVYVPAAEVPLTAAEEGHAPAPLSFALVVEAYRHEYARRYAEYGRAGGQPLPVEAPPLLSAQERRARWAQEQGTP